MRTVIEPELVDGVLQVTAMIDFARRTQPRDHSYGVTAPGSQFQIFLWEGVWSVIAGGGETVWFL